MDMIVMVKDASERWSGADGGARSGQLVVVKNANASSSMSAVIVITVIIMIIVITINILSRFLGPTKVTDLPNSLRCFSDVVETFGAWCRW